MNTVTAIAVVALSVVAVTALICRDEQQIRSAPPARPVQWLASLAWPLTLVALVAAAARVLLIY